MEVDAFADERGHGLLAAARFGAQRFDLSFGELDEEADHGDITVGGAILGSRRRGNRQTLGGRAARERGVLR